MIVCGWHFHPIGQGKQRAGGNSRPPKAGAGEIASSSITPAIIIHSVMSGAVGRQRFSQEDSDAIKEYFANIAPSLEECRKFLATHPIPGRTPKNIQDKCRILKK